MKKKEPIETNDDALPENVDVERAVLALILVSGRSYLIENLEPGDFSHVMLRFVFGELRLMWESGEPLGDVHAQIRWLKQTTVRRRSREAGVEIKPDDVAELIAWLAGEFAQVAHESYYVRVLRQMRLRRWFHQFSKAIVAKDAENACHPMKTIEWMQQQFDMVWAKAAESFPEEINA